MSDVTAITELTAEVAAAYLSNHQVAVADIPKVLTTIRESLAGTPAPVEAPVVELVPAVKISKSVTPDYIICLEDGKKLKMLKRHLRTAYNMTPDEYRAKWGLKSDYPMTAPNYANARSGLALKLGLGKRGEDRQAA